VVGKEIKIKGIKATIVGESHKKTGNPTIGQIMIKSFITSQVCPEIFNEQKIAGQNHGERKRQWGKFISSQMSLRE